MEEAAARAGNRKIFYGWYIVGAGFFANVASSFALASTLSIFLKPLTADLGVSRGVFSLLRSGEGLIGAGVAPLVGQLVDRYGGRWLLAIGAVIVGVGYLLLGQVESFTQFVAGAIDVCDPWRRYDGLHGRQYHHCPMVFAPTWPGARLLEHGDWFCQSVHADRRGLAHSLARMASNLDGFRFGGCGSWDRPRAGNYQTFA